MLGELDKKELQLSEILSVAWGVYVRNFKAIASVSLIIFIPANLIRFLVVSNADRLSSFVLSLNMVLNFLLIIIALMGICFITEQELSGKAKVSWRQALGRAVERWDRCVAANLLSVLIIIALFFLLIIPGIIWSVYYLFVTQAIMLRGLGGKEALDYSKALVRGRWWKVFAFSLVLFAVACIQLVVESYLPPAAVPAADTLMNVFLSVFDVATTVMFLNLEFTKKVDKAE